MVAKVTLSRKLVLEERVNTPDGKGGFCGGWQSLGTVWADVDARSGREALVGSRDVSKIKHRIIVRAAPMGSVRRPRADQRFREGTRIFSILAVSEFNARGRWLECWTEEGKE